MRLLTTSYRSNGVGWAGRVGRCGAILGPIIGGFLIGQGLTLQQLYLAAALPLVIGTIDCYVLSRDYLKSGGVWHRGIFFASIVYDRGWTRGLDCEVGENRR
jgi:MFS family permease